MIPIHLIDSIPGAKAEHLKSIKILLKRRYSVIRNIRAEKWIRENVENIISGSPSELFQLQNQFFIKFGNKPGLNKKLREVFKYSVFSDKDRSNNIQPDYQYNAYSLCTNLDLKYCPYCNIQPAKTIKNEQRPPLDHYFCQKEYPLLGLSFHNLIPSCTNCNSTYKGDKNFKEPDYLQPYTPHNSNTLRFKYPYDSLEEFMAINTLSTKHFKFSFSIDNSSPDYLRAWNNFRVFRLRIRYLESKREMLEKMRYVNFENSDFRKSLISASGGYITDTDLKNKFAQLLIPENWHLQPYSKAAHDFIVQYSLHIS